MTKETYAKQVLNTIRKIRENKYYPLFLTILLVILVIWLACQWFRPLLAESAGTSVDSGSVSSVPTQSSLETSPKLDQNTSREISAVVLQNISSSHETGSSDTTHHPVGAPESLTDLEQLIKRQSRIPAHDQPHLVALAVQPEPTIERGFLLVSASETEARTFNCYFSFYFDWTEKDQTSFPTLILDRLFTDQNRDIAMANQTFSDPEIILELRSWIDVLIHRESGQDICTFILDCYRRDFTNHLEHSSKDSAEIWEESRSFGDLEVTFHADRENYCTFTVA